LPLGFEQQFLIFTKKIRQRNLIFKIEADILIGRFIWNAPAQRLIP